VGPLLEFGGGGHQSLKYPHMAPRVASWVHNLLLVELISEVYLIASLELHIGPKDDLMGLLMNLLTQILADEIFLLPQILWNETHKPIVFHVVENTIISLIPVL